MIGAASAQAGVAIGDVLVRIVRTPIECAMQLARPMQSLAFRIGRGRCIWPALLGIQGSTAAKQPHADCTKMIQAAGRPVEITFFRPGGGRNARAASGAASGAELDGPCSAVFEAIPPNKAGSCTSDQ